ncbi:MAG: prepilin-type N-terminal cleavage/methylation domain-containing protein [Rubrivivax sp.]|nr:MAG: prepilin-type N-terminal cleavage/methylation domain-containing protein [Rubrivivax sp.]
MEHRARASACAIQQSSFKGIELIRVYCPLRPRQPLVGRHQPSVRRGHDDFAFQTNNHAMHRSIHPSHQKGMTLIELLMVITISAILLGIAVPSFTQFIAQQTMNGHISALASSFRLARNESLKRGLRVSMCPSSNSETTTPTCDASASTTRGWATGWLVFTDSVAPQGEINTGDVVIVAQPALPNSGGIVPGTNGYVVSFYPNGVALGAQGRFVFRSSVDPTSETKSITICVNNAGNTRKVSGSATCTPSPSP